MVNSFNWDTFPYPKRPHLIAMTNELLFNSELAIYGLLHLPFKLYEMVKLFVLCIFSNAT
jgi:hypothetical protein